MSGEVYKPEWPKLLDEALTMPGSMSGVYSRFYNYSVLNQVLLHMQGVKEPVNTYGRWADMGRQVKRGSKAKSILRPVFRKDVDEQGIEEQRLAGFKVVRCLFTVSETEGDDLPEYEPPTWSRERALGALGIRQVAFELLDGNTQGYSVGQEFAINPVAPYPLKTTMHEIAHIAIGHTQPATMAQYLQHRGIFEFQAEGTAYLAMNDIASGEEWDPAESRAYIQAWLRGDTPEDHQIKAVFTATDKILRAGRPQGGESE